MDDLVIRPATRADLPTLLQFEQGIVEAERPFDPTLSPGLIHYYDLAAMLDAADVALLVAVLQGQVVGSGFARLDPGAAYVRHRQLAYLGFMYVVPEARGRGINRRIVDALLTWARERGVTEVQLEVYSDNGPALRAYEKAGFAKLLTRMRLSRPA